MRYFKNIFRSIYVSTPNFKSGWLGYLVNEFRNVEYDFLADMAMKGQRAAPISQQNIESVISTGETLISQNIIIFKSQSLSLRREITDLEAFLAESLDDGLKEDKQSQTPSILTKAVNFIIKAKSNRELRS